MAREAQSGSGTRSGHEIAQRYCDDVVLLAGYFKPNAPGRFELSSIRALSARQLLKGQGVYLASRVLVAVTAVEVVAVAMDATALLRAQRLSWRRAELRVQQVPSRAHDDASDGRAIRLTRGGCAPGLEIAPIVEDDASAAALMDDLLAGRRRGRGHPGVARLN